jgi:putative Holliday junction resolvase
MTLLGLDIGARRIGVAMSRSGIIAEPLMTIQGRRPKMLDQLRSLITREAATVIVVGRPERLGGRSALIESFLEQLASMVPTGVTITTVDETLTTKEAERISRLGADTDALAACLILEQYLREQGVTKHAP